MDTTLSFLTHSFSLPKSLHRLLQCAPDRSALLPEGQGWQVSVGLAQVRVGWRLSPVTRSPLLLTEDLQALHGPRLGALYMTMSILVYGGTGEGALRKRTEGIL